MRESVQTDIQVMLLQHLSLLNAATVDLLHIFGQLVPAVVWQPTHILGSM